MIQEQDNFLALMQAITTCKTTLTGKIDTVQLEMGLIRKDMDKFWTRLMKVEHRVGDAEDLLRDHSTSLHTLTTKVRALEYRAEDAENCNCRNNLCVFGLPEGADSPTGSIFFILRSRMSTQDAGSSGPPRTPPRMFILRLLNYRDRDLVLGRAGSWKL